MTDEPNMNYRSSKRYLVINNAKHSVITPIKNQNIRYNIRAPRRVSLLIGDHRLRE